MKYSETEIQEKLLKAGGIIRTSSDYAAIISIPLAELTELINWEIENEATK